MGRVGLLEEVNSLVQLLVGRSPRDLIVLLPDGVGIEVLKAREKCVVERASRVSLSRLYLDGA